MRRGITLFEVLIVIAIVAVLASILYTASAPSRLQAKTVASLSNLKQCHVAVSLYRADHDGDLPYNSAYNRLTLERNDFYGVTKELTKSPCAPHPSTNASFYITFLRVHASDPGAPRPPDPNEGVEPEEHSPLFADLNCNPADLDVVADYTVKLGLAVYRDGSLLRRRRPGLVFSSKFWKEP